jgi:hypothetical protein
MSAAELTMPQFIIVTVKMRRAVLVALALWD